MIDKNIENFVSCLVLSYIHNIVRIYDQVLMASIQQKEIVMYMMHKMLNQILGTQRRIQNTAKRLRRSILRQ